MAGVDVQLLTPLEGWMDDRKRPNQGPSSKAAPPPGISSGELQQLRSRVEKLEKFVQEQLSEKNQWNPVLRGWVGSRVAVSLMSGAVITGELRWVDRYTLCLHEEGAELIVHKGAIATLRQEK